MSILNNKNRNGNFTSSEIYALTILGKRDMTKEELEEHKLQNPKSRQKTIECINTFSEKGLSYIHEKILERYVNSSIDTEVDAKPLVWGRIMEQIVGHGLAEQGYIISSDETLPHPTISFWKGSPDYKKLDGILIDTIGDIKCPYTRKSFIKLVLPSFLGLEGIDAMNALRFGFTDINSINHDKHPDGEKYYWQLVSNSCITNSKYAELRIFMPKYSYLEHIKEFVHGEDGAYWIWANNSDTLPHIPDHSSFQSEYVIKFEVPKADKDFLTHRVKLAGKELDKVSISSNY